MRPPFYTIYFTLSTFAGGVRSIALGNEAKTGLYVNNAYYGYGTSAIAIGDTSWAVGNYGVAIGYGAAAGISADGTTVTTGGTAIGLGAGALAEGATAIGAGSRVTHQSSTAIGLNAYSNADFTTAIGMTAQALSEGSMAIGYQAVAAKGIITEDGSKVATVSFGHQNGDKYYTANTDGSYTENTYNDVVLSRLSNIADGKVNTDAATYGQLVCNKEYTFNDKGVANIETNAGETAFTLKLANGMIDTGNAGYVTGGEIYTELRPTTGTYVNSSNTTAANLVALDSKIGTITGTTTIVKQDNSVSNNLVALENAIKENKTATDTAIDSVTLENKTYTFNKSNAEQNITYQNNGGTAFTIKIEGLGEGGGGPTYEAGNGIAIDTTSTNPTISAKVADKGGLFVDENGLAVKVAENGGLTVDDKGLAVQKDGKVESGNASLVTGGTVYDAMKTMDNPVAQLSGDINKVGAGAAALAALHPEGYDPNDKWSFAIGYGHYKNANAGALGAFFKPNADTTVSLASTVGNGDSMVNMGVSFKLGNKGKKAGTYRSAVDLVQRIDALEATMAKEVKRNDIQDSRLSAQEKEIKALRADSSLQAQKIAQLQADIARMQQQIANLLSDSGMVIH